MESKKGTYITFEGGEGCGKSTQARLLTQDLRDKGYRVVLTREPGGTEIGDEIRKIVQYNKSSHNMYPETEYLLFSASRAQHVGELIIPALERGDIVLCDRFYDSSTAYQGYGRKLPLSLIHEVNKFATRGLTPNLTFLLDINPQIGMERARGKEMFDRMESQDVEFYKRARQGFLEIAAKNADRFRIIDASKSIEEIRTKIKEEVWKSLGLTKV